MANQRSLTASIVLVVKKETTQKKQTKKNQEKNKLKKKKMEIIVPTMNHYPRNGQEGDPEFPQDKILIPVYKTYLYATLSPSGLCCI